MILFYSVNVPGLGNPRHSLSGDRRYILRWFEIMWSEV
jgi:hypothetical protein